MTDTRALRRGGPQGVFAERIQSRTRPFFTLPHPSILLFLSTIWGGGRSIYFLIHMYFFYSDQ